VEVQILKDLANWSGEDATRQGNHEVAREAESSSGVEVEVTRDTIAWIVYLVNT
jgi:hypothetical protein